MENKHIRYANARALLKAYKAKKNIQHGDGLSQFAVDWGKSRSQVTAMMGSKMSRPIGVKLARSLEVFMQKEPGWLDIVHDKPSTPSANEPPKKTKTPHFAWTSLITWELVAKRQTAITWDDLNTAEWCYPCLFGDEGYSPLTYALEITTDAMAQLTRETYPSGCIIFVEPDSSQYVVAGDIIIAQVQGHVLPIIRQLATEGGKLFLAPLNPTYPKIFDDFTVLGRVIDKYLPG